MYVTIPSELYANPAPIRPVGREARGTETRLRSGSYLYYEGDRVARLYQVNSGALRLTRLLEDGRRQVIAFGYPGDIVGFPRDGRHQTDCDALVDTSLQPYRLSALEDGSGDPDLHRELLQATLSEISAMQDHFMMLGRKSAAEKVASFLCVLMDRIGIDAGGYKQVVLHMSRADIADFLGLTTETVSRSLTQLRKGGVITIDNVHKVTVLQPKTLLSLSRGS